MSKITLIAPFARPPEQGWPILVNAVRLGYGVAILIDQKNEYLDLFNAADLDATLMIQTEGEYPGWAQSNNVLAKHVFEKDPECDWVACISDDTYVDQDWHANHIACQLSAHFKGTYGVCQPTGCRWADGHIDRIAGSPIIGREWARRAHAGDGPMFAPLLHMFADEALTWAAEREGVYLRRPDLTHDHQHFKRVGEEVDWSVEPPPHLKWCNTREHWDSMKAIFETFKLDYDAQYRPLAIS